MRIYAIFGSGFGLYGYLPAIAGALNATVILPESARVKFTARPELAIFESSIRWASNVSSALQQANAAVIAVPPEEQPGIAAECLRHRGIDTIVLEKPVAVTPRHAHEVLDSIMGAGRKCRVGYTLLNTAFAEALLTSDDTAEFDHLTIEWSFMAHHFSNDVDTWKRRHVQGGGALRFFGIHLVALLALLGYRNAVHSAVMCTNPGEPDRWLATVMSPGGRSASVVLDCRSPMASFRITRKCNGKKEDCVNLFDPFFSAQQADAPDRRVSCLSKLLGSLDEPDAYHHARLMEIQHLWEQIEEVTQIQNL
jgi:predicted dehydrogenase